MLLVLSLLHRQYTNEDLRLTGESCCTHVFAFCRVFPKVSIISSKLGTHDLHKLVHNYQIISNALLEQLKVGAICQA